MADNPNEFFIEALGHVLVSMVSMPVKVTDIAHLPELRGEALNVQIEFSGRHAGALCLIIEYSLMSRIAARILGIEGEILSEMVEDAARELINVVCGNFVTLMYGYSSIVRVSIPRISRMGSTAYNLMLENPDMCSFIVEGSPMLGKISAR